MELIIILIVLTIIVFFIVGIYNSLVMLKTRVENAFSQIDVQLKRRFDLIPNLIEVVKGYAKHESETLEKVISARNSYLNASNVTEKAEANNTLSANLKGLFAVAESYPDLKANTNFEKLQTELVGTEDKVAYARQFYNDTVQTYNTKIQTFPANIFAGMFNFKERDFFNDITEEQKEAPKVNF